MIGVFDSGFGGLTVLKSFVGKIQNRDFLYLGDNARAPYGGRSPEVIYIYACEAVDFLVGRGCRLIILACNTASAIALRKIQQEYLPARHPGVKVLGVVRPIAEYVASDKKVSKIGIIGTMATVASGAYDREIRALDADKRIFSQAAPLLVPLVEEGSLKKSEVNLILKRYLRPLKRNNIDSLVLACTHYPVLYNEIRRIVGKRVEVYDTGSIVADSLLDYLSRHGELGIKESREPVIRYCTTDDPDQMLIFGKRMIGLSIEEVERISLGKG